jgi:hypothetical protein
MQLKKVLAMGSIRKQGKKILGMITPTDAERLLVDWANLHDLPYSTGQAKQIRENLSAGIPAPPTDECLRLVNRNPQVFGRGALDWELNGVAGFGLTVFDLIEIRDLLRRVWNAREQRSREWYCFHLRQRFYVWESGADFIRTHPGFPFGERWSERSSYLDPPPVTPFEAAVFYLQTSIADRAKCCGGQDCPAPYFIALKRWQKYCSEACAGPANREAKRKWWHEHKGKGSL